MNLYKCPKCRKYGLLVIGTRHYCTRCRYLVYWQYTELERLLRRIAHPLILLPPFNSGWTETDYREYLNREVGVHRNLVRAFSPASSMPEKDSFDFAEQLLEEYDLGRLEDELGSGSNSNSLAAWPYSSAAEDLFNLLMDPAAVESLRPTPIVGKEVEADLYFPPAEDYCPDTLLQQQPEPTLEFSRFRQPEYPYKRVRQTRNLPPFMASRPGRLKLWTPKVFAPVTLLRKHADKVGDKLEEGQGYIVNGHFLQWDTIALPREEWEKEADYEFSYLKRKANVPRLQPSELDWRDIHGKTGGFWTLHSSVKWRPPRARKGKKWFPVAPLRSEFDVFMLECYPARFGISLTDTDRAEIRENAELVRHHSPAPVPRHPLPSSIGLDAVQYRCCGTIAKGRDCGKPSRSMSRPGYYPGDLDLWLFQQRTRHLTRTKLVRPVLDESRRIGLPKRMRIGNPRRVSRGRDWIEQVEGKWICDMPLLSEYETLLNKWHASYRLNGTLLPRI